MSWKVKAPFHKTRGRVKFKTVAEFDEWDDDAMRIIAYWARNLDPGEKVVVRRFPPA